MKVGRVNSKYIFESHRLNSDFHLAKGVVYNRFLRQKNHINLGDATSDIYCAGRSKRIYVSEQYGYPYLGNTDLSSSNPLSGCNNTSKKFWRESNGFLKEGMILTGRVGQNTVGAYTYATNDLEGTIGSDNVIRIISNNKLLNGYLFAFLASKYGYFLSRRHISGNAQPFVTEDMLAEIPVPVIEESKQQEVDCLIRASSKLRVEANKLLEIAQKKVTDSINFTSKGLGNSVKLSSIINSHQKRLESDYFISIGNEIKQHIQTLNHKFLRDLVKPIFRPGIFKRHYVEDGLDFLGGSDIVKAIPRSDKKLSLATTKHLDELKIEENWILVTCGGTIGYSVLVNNYMARKTASQHILRVIADDIPTGYLFAFLSSNLGLKAIQSFTYGSVIPQIEPHHLELLPIPIFKDELMSEVHSTVMDYKSKISESIQKELKAIELVENEIESWQKS